MITTCFGNEADALARRIGQTDYLPRWAKDEAIFNCENSWKHLYKGFFMRYINSILG